MPFRNVVFWTHLVVGLGAGLIILLMSATGVLLTYEARMIRWSDREYWDDRAGAAAASPSQWVEHATAWAEGEGLESPRVSSIAVESNPRAPVTLRFAGSGAPTVYVDPTTGDVLGQPNRGMRDFMSATRSWHRWLAVSGEGRSFARAITGWSNIVFLFLVLSGLWLWFPRKWAMQHLRPILLLNRKASGKARDFNWHNVFGFWMAIPLAIVVASATVISFPWARDALYVAVGDVSPTAASRAAAEAEAEAEAARIAAGLPAEVEEAEVVDVEPTPFAPATLDALLPVAESRVEGWRSLSVTVPQNATDELSFRIYRGQTQQPQKRVTLTLATATGVETGFQTFADQSPGSRARSYMRFAHTGQYYGFWGETLAGVASLAGVFLVWTGFALAFRRLVLRPLSKRKKAKSDVGGTAVPPAQETAPVA